LYVHRPNDKAPRQSQEEGEQAEEKATVEEKEEEGFLIVAIESIALPTSILDLLLTCLFLI
jgi:hypothetical protein